MLCHWPILFLLISYQLGPTILPNPEGSYRYLITLYTGKRRQAGTTARVVFKMVGVEDESVPIRLLDRDRPCFERGQDNAFVVSYPKGVGDVSYVQIWHDNSGMHTYTGTNTSMSKRLTNIKDILTDMSIRWSVDQIVKCRNI